MKPSKSILAAAAVTGIISGISATSHADPGTQAARLDDQKSSAHDCGGKNGCQGMSETTKAPDAGNTAGATTRKTDRAGGAGDAPTNPTPPAAGK